MALPPSRFPNAESPLHAYFYSMIELGVLRFCVEYHIFGAIPDNGTSLAELSEKTGVDSKLLVRHVNFLVAADLLRSSEPGKIEHTAISKLFQSPLANLFYPHVYDTFVGVSAKWPQYFKETGLVEPQQSHRSPFGFAAGQPDKTFYEIIAQDPVRAKSFNSAMGFTLDEMPITGVYDFKWVSDYFASPTAQAGRVSIVDVGGGKGQALKAILEENATIPPASAVLEDQTNVIEQAAVEATGNVLESVQKVAHNFFDDQPIKGALIYYIRRVLNDWPDDEAIEILGKIRAATAPDSRVLIHENLLPDEPVLGIASIDLFMMNLAGKRRNRKTFEELASKAGFKVSSVSVDESNKKTYSGVVEMVPV